MTDKQKILKWFKARKYLTVYQAIHYLSIYNARSRIAEMPNIISELIDVTRADGVKTKVARYQLTGGV